MENMEKYFTIRNGRVSGLSEKMGITLSQEAYDALSEEKKNDGTIYFIPDGDGEIGIQDTIISENSVWSSQKVSDEIAEVENKIKGSVTHNFNTQDGKVKYLKLKLGINTISVVDIYGGKIEILGGNNSVANPDYKTAKVVRHSYGDWSSYDATQVPSVISTKIGNLYYYPTDSYYYLQLNNYANFTVTGALTEPELVASLPVATSEMILIPESKYASISDTSTDTTSTWSSSMIASQISNATAIKRSDVIAANATKETGWNLAQGESHFYGRLLQLDGHLGSKSSTFSFLLFVKANYDNPTTVYATQLAGMDDDRSNIAHTTYFELGVSSNGNLTIKNKSAVAASYRFI